MSSSAIALCDDQPRAGIAAFAGVEIAAEHRRIDERLRDRHRERRSAGSCRRARAPLSSRFAAALAIVSLPTPVEPVKDTMSTAGGWSAARRHRRPVPTTMLTTPAGRPASISISPSSNVEPEVSSRRLDHRGAAGGEREGQFLADDQEREIPRRDDRDDADRLAQHHAEHGVAQRVVAFAVQVAGERCGIAPDVGGAGDLALCLGDRLAGLQRVEPGELVRARLDQVGGA